MKKMQNSLNSFVFTPVSVSYDIIIFKNNE